MTIDLVNGGARETFPAEVSATWIALVFKPSALVRRSPCPKGRKWTEVHARSRVGVAQSALGFC